MKNALSPYKGKVIVCLSTAAGFTGSFSGYVYEPSYMVFATSAIRDSRLDVIIIPQDDFSKKKTESVCGVVCTTELQTIKDMLDYINIVDDAALVETLACYYVEHGSTFAGLRMNLSPKQRAIFDKYERDALDCYKEW